MPSFLKSTKQFKDILDIRPWKVAYARVPKAANTSIKIALSEALGLAPLPGSPRATDEYWREVAPDMVGFVTPKAFASRPQYEGYFCFAVTRDPISRVVSCYKNKIIKNDTMTSSLQAAGFRLNMSFPEFVEVLAGTQDDACNIHLRSQYTMLCYKGRVLPDLVIVQEELGTRWEELRDIINERTGADLPQLTVRNSTADIDGKIALDSRLEDLIRKRYSEDYRLLFPGR